MNYSNETYTDLLLKLNNNKYIKNIIALFIALITLIIISLFFYKTTGYIYIILILLPVLIIWPIVRTIKVIEFHKDVIKIKTMFRWQYFEKDIIKTIIIRKILNNDYIIKFQFVNNKTKKFPLNLNKDFNDINNRISSYYKVLERDIHNKKN